MSEPKLPGYAAAEIADLRREIDLMQAQILLLERQPRPKRNRPSAPRTRSGRCEHPLAADHHAGTLKDGRVVWICSKCKKRDVWGDGWMYYGALECVHCSRTVVSWVRCPACAPTDAVPLDAQIGGLP